MSLSRVLRILALMCLLASMPVACVKYPWLPATAAEFIDLRMNAADPQGTESYHQDRASRLSRVTYALVLYTVGTASLIGLTIVALGARSRRVHAASWLLSALSGVAIAHFEQPRIAPSTDNVYVVIMTYLPLSIAVLAGGAGIITLAEPHWDETDTVTPDVGKPS